MPSSSLLESLQQLRANRESSPDVRFGKVVTEMGMPNLGALDQGRLGFDDVELFRLIEAHREEFSRHGTNVP